MFSDISTSFDGSNHSYLVSGSLGYQSRTITHSANLIIAGGMSDVTRSSSTQAWSTPSPAPGVWVTVKSENTRLRIKEGKVITDKDGRFRCEIVLLDPTLRFKEEDPRDYFRNFPPLLGFNRSSYAVGKSAILRFESNGSYASSEIALVDISSIVAKIDRYISSYVADVKQQVRDIVSTKVNPKTIRVRVADIDSRWQVRDAVITLRGNVQSPTKLLSDKSGNSIIPTAVPFPETEIVRLVNEFMPEFGLIPINSESFRFLRSSLTDYALSICPQYVITSMSQSTNDDGSVFFSVLYPRSYKIEIKHKDYHFYAGELKITTTQSDYTILLSELGKKVRVRIE